MVAVVKKAATLVAGLLLAGPALAADLPSRKDVAPPPPVFTWTGLYVGFNDGYAWNASEPVTLSSVNVIDESIRQFGAASAAGATGDMPARLNGFMFGGQIGYNWQFSEKFILGLESDVSGMGVRGGNGQRSIYSAGRDLSPGGVALRDPYVGTSWKANRQLEYLSTTRARFGYAITPTVMAYVTGGFAFGGANLSGAVSQTLRPGAYLADTVRGDHYNVLTGWTVGAGAEMALGHNISSKLEYLYYDLGQLWLANPSLRHENLITHAVVADATSAHARYNGHILRVGLNYRFDSTMPQTSGSAATPLFASPHVDAATRPTYGDWKFSVTPYVWAININGIETLRGQTMGTDVTIIDALTKSSSFPAIANGRVEVENGPFSAYGDVAWAQLRFAGSTLSYRSPIADVAVSASVSGRMKMNLGIGEAGVGYELGRWKFSNAPGSVTSLDGYVGTRYFNQSVKLDVDATAVVTAPIIGYERIGTRDRTGTGTLWWFDPVVGLRMRHSTAPGSAFEMRADIGGFNAGSKFSWQFFGGYHADFDYKGAKFTTLIGYRALGVDYSKWTYRGDNGINSVIHGPIIGAGLKF
jgi:opacity protein-like surface antigen